MKFFMKSKILVMFLLIGIILAIAINFYKFSDSKESVQISKTDEFCISKIYLYSNAGIVNNTTNYQNPEWNLNVYQYTDIAIYLDRLQEVFGEENYIMEMYIDNINFQESTLGTQKMYYLNPKKIGIAEITQENEIEDKLDISVINSDNESDEFSYASPIFFEDCSNPITLRYVNLDIVKNLKIGSDETLKYDGSILNRANVELEKIENTIQMNLNIKTKDEVVHTVSFNVPIKLSNENESIYDGSFEQTIDNVDLNF